MNKEKEKCSEQQSLQEALERLSNAWNEAMKPFVKEIEAASERLEKYLNRR